MDQFPTSDEEFELMYGDDLELMREQEEEPTTSSVRRSLNFSTQNKTSQNSINETNSQDKNFQISRKLSGIETINSQDENSTNKTGNTDETIETDFTKLSPIEIANKKRTIEELFGDIDDLLFEGNAKKTKTNRSNLEMIDYIIELRQKAKEKQSGATLSTKIARQSKVYNKEENLSVRVPRFPFLAVTRHDGERIYIRCHSEEYEAEELEEVKRKFSFQNVMKDMFKETWKDAQELLNRHLDGDQGGVDDVATEIPLDDGCLWVELYKPRKYMELLSDETTNRTLLKWMKLWDKVVFNRRPKVKMGNGDHLDGGKFKYVSLENSLKLDEDGMPEYRIALLCGPPGLGKTTLAHMIARHCGYNVIEINASDDRSTDTFKTILKNATQMTSVVDTEGRPNCIVFDEIDGAPSSSIDFLVKFVTGKAVKKSKKTKEVLVCKRPIICICNDLYVPALRSLRQMAFVVNFPPTTSTRLAERLNEIARHQGIKTDLGALRALCEKTGNDIRACLSVLHFFKSLNKSVTLADIWKTSVGQKDQQKGLFSVWNDLFFIPRKTAQQSDFTSRERLERVLDAVNSFGDYERVAQGVFENYPMVKIKDPTLSGTCAALDWFCFSDFVDKLIYSVQNYSLTVYLQYAFVAWHFVFGSSTKPKISFPNKNFEIRTKQERINSILTELLRGISPTLRIYLTGLSLRLDILPLLEKIISPEFRAVNYHLFTENEKEMLSLIVGIMTDYNLTYIQEKNIEGIYIYNIEPNIEQVTTFPDLPRKTNISYALKQLIAFEIQSERARRDFKPHLVTEEKEPKEKVIQEKKSERKQTEARDFFGRTISPKTGKISQLLVAKNDIWYHFNEGYSNALKKPIKVRDLK